MKKSGFRTLVAYVLTVCMMLTAFGTAFAENVTEEIRITEGDQAVKQRIRERMR